MYYDQYHKVMPYNLIDYWPAQPDDPSEIRVASVTEFSVCMFSICYKFSNSTPA